jgi:hypothetical protein
VYGNEARFVSVFLGSASDLQVKMISRTASGELRSRLHPCTYGLFLLDPHARQFGTWIQFLDDAAGRARFLWNGREVLPRLDAIQITALRSD